MKVERTACYFLVSELKQVTFCSAFPWNRRPLSACTCMYNALSVETWPLRERDTFCCRWGNWPGYFFFWDSGQDTWIQTSRACYLFAKKINKSMWASSVGFLFLARGAAWRTCSSTRLFGARMVHWRFFCEGYL
jgi:hypothetical protein